MTEYRQHGVTTVTALSWDEQRVVESGPDHAVARAVFTTAYAGDLVGESTCALLLCYVAGDPEHPETMEGPFVGYEQVTATAAGRSGTFVFEVRGEHTARVARTQVVVVPGSANGDLVGLRGAGSYAAGAMEYTLTLDYDFD